MFFSFLFFVSQVLERLLTVGIADTDWTIRRTILSSLDRRFDQFLAQAENLHSLFMALNDEVQSKT
jgi:FKBP12-rapamycin complex-associated protein